MSVQNLYNTLKQQELLSMSFEKFQDSLQDDNYKARVHETIVQENLYSGDIDTFKKDYAPSVSWFDQTWFGRGMAAASTTGEATDLMSQDFSNINIKTIQDFIEAKESEAATHVPSERMQKFQKKYVEEGKTWAAFFRGVKDNQVYCQNYLYSL